MEDKLHNPNNKPQTTMKNVIKSITTAAVITATALMGGDVAPANAGTMNCYGSENYQSCTYSEYDYNSGQYVTCYGSITRYSENWNCY